MEQWSEIRRKVLVEGVSKRQIRREYKVGSETLKKMLDFPEPPGYRRRVPRGRPKLDAFVGVIDGILAGTRIRRRRASSVTRPSGSLSGCGMSTATPAARSRFAGMWRSGLG